MSFRRDKSRIVSTGYDRRGALCLSLLALTLCSRVTLAADDKAPAKSSAAKPKAAASASAADSSLAGVGAASVPPTTPTEKRAAQLSKVAVGIDFDAGRYKQGEGKLKEAIRSCKKPDACSDSFQARLHRDLGFIYVAGMDKVEEGKNEFEIALDLDATVVLPFLMQTGAVRKAFAETKERIAKRGSEPPPKPAEVEPAKPVAKAEAKPKEVAKPEVAKAPAKEPKAAPKAEAAAKPEPKAEAAAKPEPKKESKPAPVAKAKPKGKDKKKSPLAEVEPEDVVLEDEPTPEPSKTEAKPEPAEAEAKKTAAADEAKESKPTGNGATVNWFTLSLQQDLVLHTKTANVCAVGNRYQCFDASGANHVLQAGANQVAGTTMSRGPVRLLLGYDRVVFPDASIGARLGAALFGKGERLKSDPGFFLLHLEVRATLWLGSHSFEHSGFRPYLYGCGGLGEADGSVPVNSATDGKLDAWKRSGHVFAGAGLGLQYAYEQNRAVYAEFNFLSFMSPDVPVIGIQMGYAYGI